MAFLFGVDCLFDYETLWDLVCFHINWPWCYPHLPSAFFCFWLLTCYYLNLRLVCCLETTTFSSGLVVWAGGQLPSLWAHSISSLSCVRVYVLMNSFLFGWLFLFFKIRFFWYNSDCTEVRDLLASALKVLGLKACVAMLSSYDLFNLLW